MTKVNKIVHSVTTGKITPPLTPPPSLPVDISVTHMHLERQSAILFVTRYARVQCIHTFIKWGVTFTFVDQMMQGASGNINVLSKAKGFEKLFALWQY